MIVFDIYCCEFIPSSKILLCTQHGGGFTHEVFNEMNYIDFLALLKENTKDKLDNYKELCRFCLDYQSNGIDIGDNCRSTQQRDDILNNYVNITKQYVRQNQFYCRDEERERDID